MSIKKSGMISIVGRPNVGKSTLTNALVGEKVAIVSNKPQTTRNRITGIVARGDTQFVLMDTPGFHRARTRLGEYMDKVVRESVADVDAVLLVVEPIASIGRQEEELIAQIKASGIPAVLAVNKIDTVEKGELLARGRRSAEERKARLISAAQMEGRKMSLAAKQEVLDEAFRQALEEMCSLPEEQYIQLLARLAVQASSTGREQLIFSPKDRTRIGKAVVMAANDALVKQVAPELPDAITDSKVGAFLGKVVNSAAAQITGTGLLTLSEETRPIRGGFIMVDGPVEVNCAFEAMVRAQREQLEKPVAEILFQK